MLLGVSGIYGESIYPAGPEGGWTAGLTGPHHNYGGWWAGEASAAADFRAAMRKKYGNIGAFGAGIRITNEGSDYAHNFTITREVATATRHYHTVCGFEPANGVNPTGVVARIYNATASGARQLHYYINNVLDNAAALQNFRANAAWLTPRQPRVDVALYLSRETWAFDPGAIHRLYDLSFALRDITDLDFGTRRSIADGVLRNHRVLVLAESPVLDPDTARAIEKWARNGGTLIATTRPGETLGGKPYDNTAWRERLLANATTSSDLLTPTCANAPAHWKLDVGSGKDDAWLFGDWHGRERGSLWPEIANSTMRWTGSRPGTLLPTRPGANYKLRLAANIVGFALDGEPILARINGQPVGKLDREGKHVFELSVPAKILGDATVTRLELAMKTWKPSERTKSGDTRNLGIALRQVEWIRAGAENEPSASAMLRFEINRSAHAALRRRVGKGQTIFLPGLSGKPATVARMLATALRSPADGQLDGRVVTITDDALLWFDSRSGRIWASKQ